MRRFSLCNGKRTDFPWYRPNSANKQNAGASDPRASCLIGRKYRHKAVCGMLPSEAASDSFRSGQSHFTAKLPVAQ